LARVSEREVDPLEQARVEAGQHVRLVLRLVGGTGEQEPAVAPHDARVVARDEPLGAGAAREREQLGEPERSVAPDAGVGRLAAAARPADGAARKIDPSAFASASAASVSPGTAAASSSESPPSGRSSPGASASTMRSPSTIRRTSAQSPSRDESPTTSIIRSG